MKTITFVIVLLVSSIVIASTQRIDSLESLNHVSRTGSSSSRETNITVKANYRILSHASFTSTPDIFKFNQYSIEVMDKSDLDNMTLKISVLNNNNKQATINFDDIQFPWWNTSVDFAKLDFTVLKRKDESYILNNKYRLNVMPNQGAWGKVYTLEEHSKSGTKVVAAVKLIHTKSKYKISTNEFRRRHKAEIINNIRVSGFSIACKPYGIIKIDEDNYVLIMQYGENSQTEIIDKDISRNSVMLVNNFLSELKHIHNLGWSHGDVKFPNIVMVDGGLKLCDWFSLLHTNEFTVGQYRYIGDHLPPEAMRAHFFGKNDDTLQYALVKHKGNESLYMLHPVASDYYCFGISLLEWLEPSLFKEFNELNPKGFNPYRPDSLDFWEKHAEFIEKAQSSLRAKAKQINDMDISNLYMHLSNMIDLDPVKRFN